MSEPGRRVTAAEAEELIGIPAARIHKWKHRNLLVPIDLIRGPGRGGLVPVYDLEHIRRLLAGAALDRGAARSDTP